MMMQHTRRNLRFFIDCFQPLTLGNELLEGCSSSLPNYKSPLSVPLKTGRQKASERLPWPSPALAAPCRISLASIAFYWIFPLATRPSSRFFPPLLSITNDSINHHFHIKSKNCVLHDKLTSHSLNGRARHESLLLNRSLYKCTN